VSTPTGAGITQHLQALPARPPRRANPICGGLASDAHASLLPSLPPRRAVLLQNGKAIFQLVEGRAGLFGSLRSGMTVAARGKWLPRRAAGKAAAAAGALGPKRFQVTSLQASGGRKAPKPSVTRERPLPPSFLGSCAAQVARSSIAAGSLPALPPKLLAPCSRLQASPR
jgi:hypothetical protein